MLESVFKKGKSLKARNFVKKTVQNRCFPVKIAKFSKIPILKNVYERLVLDLETHWWQMSALSMIKQKCDCLG